MPRLTFEEAIEMTNIYVTHYVLRVGNTALSKLELRVLLQADSSNSKDSPVFTLPPSNASWQLIQDIAAQYSANNEISVSVVLGGTDYRYPDWDVLQGMTLQKWHGGLDAQLDALRHAAADSMLEAEVTVNLSPRQRAQHLVYELDSDLVNLLARLTDSDHADLGGFLGEHFFETLASVLTTAKAWDRGRR